MQEANVLYVMVSVVVTGLVVWTGFILAKVRTSWAREAPRIVIGPPPEGGPLEAPPTAESTATDTSAPAAAAPSATEDPKPEAPEATESAAEEKRDG